MQSTPYPQMNDLLDDLLAGMRGVLGERLIGVYLYGSLVAGGFDDALSDVDLLAVTAGDIDVGELDALRVMHDRFVRDRPRWDDRIEVAYLSVAALRTFKERTSRIGIISPGEPLHFKEAGRDWLMNWYLVRDGGRTLHGPPPEELIPSVSKAEFVESVRDHARGWGDGIDRMRGRGPLSYVILTLCRTLYTHETGEHVSKEGAAAWARRDLPEWADLIGEALLWRVTRHGHDGMAVPDAARFARAVRERIGG